MALGYDGSIRIKADLNHKSFDKGISSMTSTLKKFAGIVGIAFSVGAIANFGKEAIKAASDLSNAWLGLQSIIEGQGKSFSKAKSFINDYISDGLVPLENAVTAYKNLAARGYNTDQIEQTLTALKDAAAFGRQASYSLGDAVTSATEGLKNENSILVDNAGVTKNVAKMWDEYAKSIGTTANNLTQAQKIQAEVNGILNETRFQTGDAAKVAGTYSGQVSLLSYNFQNLKVAVGNALIPIAQAVLPGINAIIAALTKLANVFAQVMSLLFGKSPATSGVASTQNALASTGGAAANAANKLADAESNAGSAAKKAGKDMKGVLAGFDDLTVLADNTASSLDNAADSMDIDAGGLDLTGIETGGELFADAKINPELEKGIQKIIDRFKELGDFFKKGFKLGASNIDISGITEKISQIRDHLSNIFTDEDVGNAASRLLNSFAYRFGAETGSLVSIGSTIVSALLGGIEQYLGENADRIKGWMIRIFDVGIEINEMIAEFSTAFADVFSVFGDESSQSIIASIIQIFSDVFGGAIEIAQKFGRDVIDTITGPFVENKDLIKTTIEGTLQPIAQIMESIKDVVRGAVDKIVSLYDEHIHPFIMSIKESFTEWFEHILNGYNTYIKPVLDKFAAKFKEVVEQHVGPMIEKAVKFFGKLFDAVKDIWDNILSPLVSWIIDTAYPIVAEALDAIGTVFNTLFSVISDVVGAIFDILGGVIDFIAGVFTGDWERAWDGLKSIFKGIWNAIVSVLEGAINLIIRGINWVIKQLNKISINIPSFLGGGTIGFNISEIKEKTLPRLANGAVIPPNQQFAAILGDQRSGTNIEAPASLIRQMVEEGIRAASNTGSRQPIQVNIMLDKKVLARAMVGEVNNMTRAAGKPVLLV